MTRYFLPNGLLARGFVLLLSITVVSCSDYSQKTVDVNAAPYRASDVIGKETVDDKLTRIPPHFEHDPKYPPGHTTVISVVWDTYDVLLNNVQDAVIERFKEVIYNKEETIRNETNAIASTLPKGGKIKVTFYDEDTEKLNISNFEFSLFSDGERVIDEETFDVSEEPMEFNTTTFKNTVELNIPADVSDAGVVILEIYDTISRTTIEFIMTNKILSTTS